MTSEYGMGLHTEGRPKHLGPVETICSWNFLAALKTFPSCVCYFWLAKLSLLPLHFPHNAAFLPSALTQGHNPGIPGVQRKVALALASAHRPEGSWGAIGELS